MGSNISKALQMRFGGTCTWLRMWLVNKVSYSGNKKSLWIKLHKKNKKVTTTTTTKVQLHMISPW